MKGILNQLARSGLLFDEEKEAAIFAGNPPPLEDPVKELILGAMDAEVVIRNDAQSSWNGRRLARLGLIVAFLSAIACTREKDAL